jgi:hypothetical protein
LFVKLWPKLLDACAIEAVAEQRKGDAFQVPDQKAVSAFLSNAERGPAIEKSVSREVTSIFKETSESVLYETVESKSGGCVRRGYLNKNYDQSPKP